MWKCNWCGEVFSEDEAVPRPLYVDDSNRVWHYIPTCPFCGDEDIDEYVEPDEEEEDE